MNTEEQLRHASREMDRVTAPLVGPPIDEVRRSARRRGVWFAVTAAVGVIVLVGGVALALRPGGETSLGPANPGEATLPPEVVSPTLPSEVEGFPISRPQLDPAPEFDPGPDSIEIELAGIPAAIRDNDVMLALRYPREVPFDEDVEVVVLGNSGEEDVYAFRGTFAVGAGPTGPGECIVTVAGIDDHAQWCGTRSARGMGTSVDVVDGIATFTVAGRAREGASVVVLEIDDTRYFQRTRDGYAYLSVTGAEQARARYIVYDVSGSVLEGTTFYTGQGDVSETTTAPAVADDGSCSGGLYYPSTYPQEDLPEAVVQTLGKITLFGSRCWFDDLELVAGDGFTASFGGGDPSDLWTRQEENGEQPMYQLMRILDMPHGTVDLGDQLMYVWPSAAAFDGPWDEMPDVDKEPLRALYDEEDFADFASFGGYIGYRIGITADGDWSFFVAGD